jgi:TolC family type I secretion outer membrane protein
LAPFEALTESPRVFAMKRTLHAHTLPRSLKLRAPSRLRSLAVAACCAVAALGTAAVAQTAAPRTPQWGDPLPVATTALAAAGATTAATEKPTQAAAAAPINTTPASPPSPGAMASLWAGLGTLWGDVNPLAAGPVVPTSKPYTVGASRNSQDRNARIGELPELLGVPALLPLDEKASPAAATASTTAPTATINGTLSLQQAIELGVANSLDVKAAAARRDSFVYTASAARGALLPHADLRVGAGQGRTGRFSDGEDRHRKEGNVTLRQALFDLPKLRELQRQNVLTLSADLQLQAATSSASLETASAYLQALQARLALALGADYERLLGTLLTHITDRAQAGGASGAERDRVRARVANARAQMADSRANLRAALRNLTSLTAVTPAQLAVGVPQALAVPLVADDARSQAHEFNRDLSAARSDATAAAMEAYVARARLLPTLDAEITHSRATNASGAASYSRDTKAMLVLNWNLSNGGSDLAQQRAAHARSQEKKLRADDIERRLDQDLEGAYAALDSVAERYSALRDELAANTTVVDAFRAQLVGGNRPLLDVLDAYQRLHSSRLELAGLVVNEVQNHAKVAHLTGRLGQGMAPWATAP